MVFDDGALFLDDQHFFESFGKLAHDLAVQRPAHTQLQHPQTDLGGQRVVYAEIFQGLANIQIGFSGSDNADTRHGAVDDDFVDGVRAGEGDGRIELVLVQAHFLLQRLVGPAGMQAAVGEQEILRPDNVDPLGIDAH